MNNSCIFFIHFQQVRVLKIGFLLSFLDYSYLFGSYFKLIKPWSDIQVSVTKLELEDERSWKMTLFYENYLNSNWYQMIWANADKVSPC